MIILNYLREICIFAKKKIMLTKGDCLVLKGLAIMSIIMHNYCHLLSGAAHENEFFFSEENYCYFWNNFFSSNMIIHFFSFWGHLGVPVFVFLTGYGLAIKYKDSGNFITIRSFVCSHYLKLFVPMFCGMLTFFSVFLMLNGELWIDWWKTFLTQMTLLNNMVIHPDLMIKPGVYWYFGLTMQLYVIFRLMVYRRSSCLLIFFVLLSMIAMILLKSKHYSMIWFKYNSVGWLLPFAIGIWSARYWIIPIKHKYYWIALFVFFGGSVLFFGSNFFLWLLSPAFTIIFFVSLCKLLKRTVYKLFLFIGNLSFCIFVVHPIIREVILFVMPFNSCVYIGLLIYIFLVIICSWCIYYISNHYRQLINI